VVPLQIRKKLYLQEMGQIDLNEAIEGADLELRHTHVSGKDPVKYTWGDMSHEVQEQICQV